MNYYKTNYFNTNYGYKTETLNYYNKYYGNKYEQPITKQCGECKTLLSWATSECSVCKQKTIIAILKMVLKKENVLFTLLPRDILLKIIDLVDMA